jgi:hypothetical protein
MVLQRSDGAWRCRLVDWFRDGKIKPEDFQRLDRALLLALRCLHLVDRNDPICELVAQKIVSIDAAGIHDPDAIAKLAVKQLGP